VAVQNNHVGPEVFGHCGDFVAQVVVVDTTGELDMGVRPDQHVNVT
jgi:hypothetical protein